MQQTSVLLFIGLFALASCTIYFQEEFDEGWESRWVYSTADESAGTNGAFRATAGKWFNDRAKDTGIKTNEDARFYKMSARFPKFSNKDKTLVLQYSVKHEQNLDCGGAYIKLYPPGTDQKTLTGETQYNIMFGPDKCGSKVRVTHFIIHYKGKNHQIKKHIMPVMDTLTHLYTAIIFPNQTYEVRIDNKKIESGTLPEDWYFLPPAEIPDPAQSKPEDWVDDAKIPDPDAKKPEGWDDVPAEIPDPYAEKPEDWDPEMDGEYEPPVIPNPEYKGEWKPPLINNPAYKGPWEHPLIPNPDYYEDDNIYAFEHEFVGFEIWQVRSGTIFDHILITDSIEEAEAFADGYFKEQQIGEKEALEEWNAEQEALKQYEAELLEEEDQEEEEGDELNEQEIEHGQDHEPEHEQEHEHEHEREREEKKHKHEDEKHKEKKKEKHEKEHKKDKRDRDDKEKSDKHKKDKHKKDKHKKDKHEDEQGRKDKDEL